MLGNRPIPKFLKNNIILTRKFDFKKNNGKIRFFEQILLLVVLEWRTHLKKTFNLCCGSHKATKVMPRLQFECEESWEKTPKFPIEN